MGVLFKHYLTGTEVYVCSSCKTHFTLPSLLISKAFTGANGKAYLFKRVVNVDEGSSEERDLLTGKHIVCDVTCIQCKCYIGWKYVKAFPKDQEYKTGSYVLEKTFITLLNQNQPISVIDLRNPITAVTTMEDIGRTTISDLSPIESTTIADTIQDIDSSYTYTNCNIDDLVLFSSSTIQPSDTVTYVDQNDHDGICDFSEQEVITLSPMLNHVHSIHLYSQSQDQNTLHESDHDEEDWIVRT